ncbi:hypothetical protein Tdes44962_MAKER02388 [Teratosphaeria destructans]|uniref:Uncharacterized protein n=1 Tax=Teratosphaeria destructans TaxID=418781 RepID=A0A9W7STP4_9PEZI|nr:hypothetical protein Tdes44962_MAKER02388 [Teratosphaeria destructans]
MADRTSIVEHEWSQAPGLVHLNDQQGQDPPVTLQHITYDEQLQDYQDSNLFGQDKSYNESFMARQQSADGNLEKFPGSGHLVEDVHGGNTIKNVLGGQRYGHHKAPTIEHDSSLTLPMPLEQIAHHQLQYMQRLETRVDELSGTFGGVMNTCKAFNSCLSDFDSRHSHILDRVKSVEKDVELLQARIEPLNDVVSLQSQFHGLKAGLEAELEYQQGFQKCVLALIDIVYQKQPAKKYRAIFREFREQGRPRSTA